MRKKTLILFPIIFLLCAQFFDEVPFLYLIDKTGFKHVLLILFVLIGLGNGIRNNDFKFSITYEVKRVVIVSVILFMISFVYMILNGISFDWISEIYYLIIPIIFVHLVFFKDSTIYALNKVMNMFLLGMIFCFGIFVWTIVSKGLYLNFSFIKSSSPFENPCAHMFLMLYIYYTFINEKTKRIITAVCCILAWKRMCLLYLIFITIFHSKIRRNGIVSKEFYALIAGIALCLPVILQILLTDSFSQWFTSLTGLDLHAFLMFRFETIVTAFESDDLSRGLGTFLWIDVPWYNKIVHVSIHNDIVRLYLEVSAVGLVCFAYGISSIAKNNYSFLIMVYLFIEMACSHFLGNGSLPFWILAYSMIFCFNRYTRDRGKELYI